MCSAKSLKIVSITTKDGPTPLLLNEVVSRVDSSTGAMRRWEGKRLCTWAIFLFVAVESLCIGSTLAQGETETHFFPDVCFYEGDNLILCREQFRQLKVPVP